MHAAVINDSAKQKGDEKRKRLTEALTKIDREFGVGTVVRLGDEPFTKVEGISTGAINLDAAIGIGGVPRGRITEVYGPESSGKTSLALHVIAEAQKTGGVCGFVDVEHALDTDYAAAIGVDTDELLVSQPSSGEDALNVALALIESNSVDVVVIDSVAALVTKAELEGDIGDAVVGQQARLMSQGCRKMTASIARSNCAVIFINQLREKIGVMFGSPETTSGGKALKFYASLRLDIRKTEQIKKGTDIIGSRTKVKIVKNKVAPPFKTAEFDMIYGKGIYKWGCLLDVALERGVVAKTGSWYTYGNQRLAQGRDGSAAYLENTPNVADEIRAKIVAKDAEAKAPALAVVADIKEIVEIA